MKTTLLAASLALSPMAHANDANTTSYTAPNAPEGFFDENCITPVAVAQLRDSDNSHDPDDLRKALVHMTETWTKSFAYLRGDNPFICDDPMTENRQAMGVPVNVNIENGVLGIDKGTLTVHTACVTVPEKDDLEERLKKRAPLLDPQKQLEGEVTLSTGRGATPFKAKVTCGGPGNFVASISEASLKEASDHAFYNNNLIEGWLNRAERFIAMDGDKKRWESPSLGQRTFAIVNPSRTTNNINSTCTEGVGGEVVIAGFGGSYSEQDCPDGTFRSFGISMPGTKVKFRGKRKEEGKQ